MKKKWQKSSLMALGALGVAAGVYLAFDERREQPVEERPGVLKGRRVVRSDCSERPSRFDRKIGESAIAKAKVVGCEWGEDPFAEKPAFDFDEEAGLSDELKQMIADLSSAYRTFNPNRKDVYAAASKLVAAINAGKGDSVPRFVKLEAVEALKWLGVDGVPEMVGMAGDADEVVVKSATDALMEQLIDFDATEADQLAILKQLVRMDLTVDQYESIVFTLSSFRNAAKVTGALAIYDHGTEGALAALRNNTEFVFDEAAAESISTRADIVQYGKDHPDSNTDFEIRVEQ